MIGALILAIIATLHRTSRHKGSALPTPLPRIDACDARER